MPKEYEPFIWGAIISGIVIFLFLAFVIIKNITVSTIAKKSKRLKDLGRYNKTLADHLNNESTDLFNKSIKVESDDLDKEASKYIKDNIDLYRKTINIYKHNKNLFDEYYKKLDIILKRPSPFKNKLIAKIEYKIIMKNIKYNKTPNIKLIINNKEYNEDYIISKASK